MNSFFSVFFILLLFFNSFPCSKMLGFENAWTTSLTYTNVENLSHLDDNIDIVLEVFEIHDILLFSALAALERGARKA